MLTLCYDGMSLPSGVGWTRHIQRVGRGTDAVSSAFHRRFDKDSQRRVRLAGLPGLIDDRQRMIPEL